MKRWITCAALAVMSLSSTSIFADCDHSITKTNNFQIPVGRLVLNPETDNGLFAFSFFGEAGVRDARFGGTAASWTTERSRLKISGEYLTQELAWKFTSGKDRRWNQQAAGGLDWQYLLDDDFYCFKAFDVSGFYSYAQSRNPSTIECDEIIVTPDGTFFLDIARHVAGARAYGGAFTTLMAFGENTVLNLSLNYDNVRYRRVFSDNKSVCGLGGSFLLTTRLVPCCMDFSLEGQFRKPFNYFGARLTLPRANFRNNVAVTLFAGVTRGKYALPNSTTVGVELVYNFQTGCNRVSQTDCCAPIWDPCNLNAWALRPAVFLPEVLAIAEELQILIPTPPPG